MNTLSSGEIFSCVTLEIALYCIICITLFVWCNHTFAMGPDGPYFGLGQLLVVTAFGNFTRLCILCMMTWHASHAELNQKWVQCCTVCSFYISNNNGIHHLGDLTRKKQNKILKLDQSSSWDFQVSFPVYYKHSDFLFRESNQTVICTEARAFRIIRQRGAVNSNQIELKLQYLEAVVFFASPIL